MNRKQIYANIAFASAYMLTAYFGLTVDSVGGFATVVWPPSGIALAAILLLGRWIWPGIAIAAFLVNWLSGGPVLSSLGIAIGNTLEALVISAVLQRFDFSNSFSRSRDVLLFYTSVIGTTVLAACIGAFCLFAGGLIPLDRVPYAGLVWWFGDMMGCIVVTPLILAVVHHRTPRFKALRVIENAFVGTLLIGLCYFIFANPHPELEKYPKSYLFFPLFAWASVRFGQIGTTTAIFFVSAFAISATILGVGPFSNGNLTEGLLHLQSFILALSLTSLLTSSYVTELRRTERTVRTMLDEAQKIARLGSWELEVPTGKVTWSKMMYELNDVKREEFDGTFEGYLKLQSAAQVPIRESLAKIFEAKKYSEFDYPITTKDGRKRILHARGRVFQNESGEIVRIVGTSQDVTEAKRIEEELVQARREAEEANTAKSNFLANMSHEIRSPLSVILGYSELLIDPNETPEKRAEYVKVIQKNGAMLSELITDILDLSKVEAGKLSVQKEEIHLQQFMEDLELLMKGKAQERGLELRFSYFGSLPSTIETDPRLLRQAFVNVIGNAIKFTAQGKVEVRTSLMSDPENRLHLAFDIVDTGIGLSPEQRKRLFKRFAQADSTMTRKFGGTGLGLILSKRFANCLGGDLRIRASAPGRGSCFRLTIDPGPLENRKFVTHLNAHRESHEAVAGTPGLRSHELEGKSILVVDDSIDNQVLVSHFLKAAGANVSQAMNGAEAMEKALAGNYDMVLMDIQMPVLDGLRATVALRKKGFSKPIVALTAHALSEERDRCLESGFNAYLSKPIKREELIEELAHVH